jgi:ABC-type phosphate transport system ATPase subunit
VFTWISPAWCWTISTPGDREHDWELKMDHTIVIGAHKMQRAPRISHQSGYENTERIFTNLRAKAAKAYVSGRLR